MDETQIYKVCEEYMDWLAEKLSTNGCVSETDVIRKLDDLLCKFADRRD